MKLTVENFGKIKNADINIDGITVIAGENNTGKSTIGKILYASFNSIREIDKKVIERKKTAIQSQILFSILEYFDSDDDMFHKYFSDEFRHVQKKIEKFSIHDNTSSREELYSFIKSIIQDVEKETNNSVEEKFDKANLEELITKILKIFQLPNDEVACVEISNYFTDVFNNQINSLRRNDDDVSIAKISLDIKSKKINLEFEAEKCVTLKKDVNIMKKAIYIDNPFIIDEIDDSHLYRRKRNNNKSSDFLCYLLRNVKEKNQHKEIVNNILAKQKLSEIMNLLEKIISGRIYVESGNKFYVENNNYIEGISIKNISAGLKSFAILKMLIENSVLIEKDVLILDEPEIHLHPQWQIFYAELIVLLQKSFDLSIIVTTHSPYFLDAIDLFSIKHGIKEKMNFYLSESEENGVVFKNVSNNIELIYDKMASPLSILETLRLELGQ